ncbi:unnamed protein product [Ceratitis capitata]|uniref:(Mediterranean fruit fly) hypothetical protein n=1 Tax=Ceratitis capitata TaxID=7213 RepID=A0A811V3K3_CERCA|nr:unnamed protein product [Ceratitis capitata]
MPKGKEKTLRLTSLLRELTYLHTHTLVLIYVCTCCLRCWLEVAHSCVRVARVSKYLRFFFATNSEKRKCSNT